MTNFLHLGGQCSAILLIFGLISCVPDQPKVSKFRISPPLLSEGEQNVSFASATSKGTLVWSPKAKINFGNELLGARAQVFIESFCSNEKSEEQAFNNFEPLSEVSLFQLLPLNLIHAEVSQNFQCSLKFKVLHPDGASHIFSIEKLLLKTDPTAMGLILKTNGAFESPDFMDSKKLTLNEVTSLEVFPTMAHSSEIVLDCDFHRFKLPIGDYRKVRAKDGAPISVEDFPSQKCRFVELFNGHAVTRSRLLRIQFPQRIWPLSPFKSGVIKQVQETVLAERWFKNDRANPIWLKWSQHQQGEILLHLFPNLDNKINVGNFHAVLKVPGRMKEIEIKGTHKKIRNASDFFLRLDAGSEVKLAIVVGGHPRCFTPNGKHSISVSRLYTVANDFGPELVQSTLIDLAMPENISTGGPIPWMAPGQISEDDYIFKESRQLMSALNIPLGGMLCELL